jgi:hypothetical protein
MNDRPQRRKRRRRRRSQLWGEQQQHNKKKVEKEQQQLITGALSLKGRVDKVTYYWLTFTPEPQVQRNQESWFLYLRLGVKINQFMPEIMPSINYARRALAENHIRHYINEKLSPVTKNGIIDARNVIHAFFCLPCISGQRSKLAGHYGVASYYSFLPSTRLCLPRCSVPSLITTPQLLRTDMVNNGHIFVKYLFPTMPRLSDNETSISSIHTYFV